MIYLFAVNLIGVCMVKSVKIISSIELKKKITSFTN